MKIVIDFTEGDDGLVTADISTVGKVTTGDALHAAAALLTPFEDPKVLQKPAVSEAISALLAMLSKEFGDAS